MRSWYHGTHNGPLSLFWDVHPRIGRRHKFVVSSIQQYPTVNRMVPWCGSRPASAQIEWRTRHGANCNGVAAPSRILSWYVGNANALCSRPEKTARPASTIIVMRPCSMEIVNATAVTGFGGVQLQQITRVYKRVPWSAAR